MLVASQKTISNTATRIDTEAADDNGRWNCVIRNIGSATVYVGHSDVTTSNGFPIEPDVEYNVDLARKDRGLFAVSSTSGVVAALGVVEAR